MDTKRLILIGGGARSGKSAFALELARGLGERRVYLATAEAGDAEMRERIARHRAERGAAFRTVEEPVALREALGAIEAADVVVVDCLTLWVANLLGRGRGEEEIVGEAEGLADFLQKSSFHAILVTNEVGMGVVPAYASARAFRDACGRVHQRLSRRADEVYFAALGLVVRMKPGPGGFPAPPA